MSKSSSSSSNLRLSVGSGAPVRVHKVRDDELSKLRELFSKHDKDNSHSIDQHELEGLLAEWTEEERPEDSENVLYIAKELMQRIDTDGNGYITFVEFLRSFKILHDVIETEAVKHPTKARLAKLAEAATATEAAEGDDKKDENAPKEDDEGNYVEIVDHGGGDGAASSSLVVERHEKETNTDDVAAEEEEGGGSRHPHHDTIVRELQDQIVGLQHMQQEVKDLQADKEQMKKAHQTECGEFAARESDYKTRLEAIQKEMNEMKSLHDADVSSLQNQLDTMKGARDDADKNYEKVNAKLLEMKDSHDKLVQHAAEADASSSKYMEQLRDERDQYSSRVKEHEDAQQKDKERMSELAARISELEANSQKSNDETEKMRKDAVQKEEGNKTKIQTLEANLAEAIKERDDLRVRSVNVEEQIHQAAEKKIKDQQTHATNEIERLTSSLKENEKVNNRLKKLIDDYTADKKSWEDAEKTNDALRNEQKIEIEATLVKMKQEKEQYKHEKGELEATIQRLKDEKNNQKQATALLLEKVRKEVEEDFGRRSSVAEANSKVLMEEMKKATGNIDHLRDSFEKEVSSLKAEIDGKMRENAEYRDQSEQQLLFLQSANDRLKEEITQKQQANVSFSRRLHDLEENIHKGRVEYDDLQKHHLQVTRDLETRLTQARDEVAQSRRDVAAGLAPAKPQMHNIHTYYFVAGGFVGAVIGLSLRYIFK